MSFGRRIILKKNFRILLVFTLVLQLFNITAFSAVTSANGVSAIADARVLDKGTNVTVEGVVTFVEGKNLYVQDETAGIVVRGDDYTFKQGDKLRVTGSLDAYFDTEQINANVTDIEVLAQGVETLPRVITSSDLTSNSEKYESMLIKVANVKVSSVDKYKNFTTEDSNGTFLVLGGYVAVENSYESVTGIVKYNYGQHKVFPRNNDDVIGSASGEVVLTTIAEAKEKEGSEVLIEGIVTAGFEKGGKMNYYVQDDTAGVIVRVEGVSVSKGDKISAKGKMDSYYGMQQLLAGAEDVQVIEANAGVPAAKAVLSSDLAKEVGESMEAQFVKVINATVGEGNKYGEYTVTDANGTFIVKPEVKETLTSGKTYDIIYGVVDYSFGSYKLIPRDKLDAVEDVNAVIATPEEKRIVIGSKVELMTFAENATIYYTLDGSVPTAASIVYDAPITINEDTTIKAIVVTDEVTGNVYEFVYTAIQSLEGISIHDIQGAAHLSPFEGLAVSNVKGIVTYLDKYGFYMQEPNADNDIRTSEGIYVYMKNSGVTIGDHVSVSGKVKEHRQRGYDDANDLLTTQISATNVAILSSGNALPEAILIGKDGRALPTEIIDNDGMEIFDPQEDGLDFYESLEGMLVAVQDAEVIAPPKYGEIAVFVNSGQAAIRTPSNGLLITSEDLNPERILIFADELVKVGDRFDGTITGVVTYSYSNFKLQPTKALPAVIEGELTQEITTIVPNADELTVAAYNVENFSAEKTSAEKTTKIAKSIIENLKNPDIIGLVEVQDNDGPTDSGTTDGSESYQKLIDAIIAEGGPTYAFTEIAPEDKADGGQPGGNIRVGYLYNVDRVSLSEKPAGSATTAVGADENGLTVNPGRIDPTNEIFANTRKSLAAEFIFNGEKVIVINNHFNSKRGDDPLFGATQPALLGSETQRVKLAAAVNGFVKEILSHNANANVVVLGDMNDFEFSNPLRTLEGNELTNMVNMLPQEERYTYIYQGNSQVLDNILVSNNIVLGTKVDIVHINAEFAEEHGRASDHDPVLIQMNFSEKKQTVVETSAVTKGKKATVSDEIVNEVSYKGTLHVTVEDEIFSLSLSKKQMTALIEKQSKVVVNNGTVSMALNTEMLSEEKVVFNFSQLADIDEALSKVYDFTINVGGKNVTQFKSPITLTFTVDQGKVNNPEDVKVYYYHTEAKEWKLVGGTYVNGVVTTNTDHITAFAAYDVASEKPAMPEKELPNTATNMYNMIALGMLLLLIGGVILYRKKRIEE
jgi:uncharacterized protein